jgi:hypothetical protein
MEKEVFILGVFVRMEDLVSTEMDVICLPCKVFFFHWRDLVTGKAPEVERHWRWITTFVDAMGRGTVALRR